MTQDRSTPLVVEEARGHASLLTCALCNSLLTRLADRVEAREHLLRKAATWFEDEARHAVPGTQITMLLEYADEIRQALSTQPHQDKT